MGQDLEYIFHPRSIAAAGVSSDPATSPGRAMLAALLDFVFEGEIYPINPNSEPNPGLKELPRYF